MGFGDGCNKISVFKYGCTIAPRTRSHKSILSTEKPFLVSSYCREAADSARHTGTPAWSSIGLSFSPMKDGNQYRRFQIIQLSKMSMRRPEHGLWSLSEFKGNTKLFLGSDCLPGMSLIFEHVHSEDDQLRHCKAKLRRGSFRPLKYGLLVRPAMLAST